MTTVYITTILSSASTTSNGVKPFLDKPFYFDKPFTGVDGFFSVDFARFGCPPTGARRQVRV